MNPLAKNYIKSEMPDFLRYAILTLSLALCLAACQSRKSIGETRATLELTGCFGGDIFFEWGARKTKLVQTMLSRPDVRADSEHEKKFVTPELHFKGGTLFGLRVSDWAFAFGDSVRADSVHSIGLYFAQVIFDGNEKTNENFARLDSLICAAYQMTSTLEASTGKMTYHFPNRNEITLSLVKIGKKPPTISLEYLNNEKLEQGIAKMEQKP
jgi:hypothetical protein